MPYFKTGTNIPFTDEEYIDMTMNRLSRIARKGMHRDHYTFLVHETREALTELVKEIMINHGVKLERDVKNTPLCDHIWNDS